MVLLQFVVVGYGASTSTHAPPAQSFLERRARWSSALVDGFAQDQRAEALGEPRVWRKLDGRERVLHVLDRRRWLGQREVGFRGDRARPGRVIDAGLARQQRERAGRTDHTAHPHRIRMRCRAVLDRAEAA
jgi:hypothetical protein